MKLSHILFYIAVFIFVLVWAILGFSTIDLSYWITNETKFEIFSYNAMLEEYKDHIPGLIYKTNNRNDIESMVISKYPELYRLGDLLEQWNPNDVAPIHWTKSLAHPDRKVGSGILRFDFLNSKEMAIAELHRDAELPFVIYNIPELTTASEINFSLNNLLENMGKTNLHDVEISENNKFVYFNVKDENAVRELYPSWKQPQDRVRMKFTDFLSQAESVEAKSSDITANSSLFYLTISANKGYMTPWIREALPFFDEKKSFFIVDPSKIHGINCRFGSKGVVAAAHFDSGRNFVAMLRGRKRYVLLPPSECRSLSLLPRGHPSARHSYIDWSDPNELRLHQELYNASATEYVLSAGEMLYIPSYWFHYIVSQDSSIQCNCRSGESEQGREHITGCGIGIDKSKSKKTDLQDNDIMVPKKKLRQRQRQRRERGQ